MEISQMQRSELMAWIARRSLNKICVVEYSADFECTRETGKCIW